MIVASNTLPLHRGQGLCPFWGYLPLGQRVEKARHFADKFWLYVVTDAGTDAPQLHRIQNPAAHFRMGEDIFATGFIIHEETWREKTRSE